ncbi:hypothetical protein ACJX0J_038837 [Zea mays]
MYYSIVLAYVCRYRSAYADRSAYLTIIFFESLVSVSSVYRSSALIIAAQFYYYYSMFLLFNFTCHMLLSEKNPSGEEGRGRRYLSESKSHHFGWFLHCGRLIN